MFVCTSGWLLYEIYYDYFPGLSITYVESSSLYYVKQDGTLTPAVTLTTSFYPSLPLLLLKWTLSWLWCILYCFHCLSSSSACEMNTFKTVYGDSYSIQTSKLGKLGFSLSIKSCISLFPKWRLLTYLNQTYITKINDVFCKMYPCGDCAECYASFDLNE